MRRRDFLAMLGGAGAAPLLPLPLCAQPAGQPVIGLMSSRSAEESVHLMAAMRQGLAEGGFAEGRNVVIDYRWANGDYERLPALAAELVQRRVAVLIAIGGEASVRAAKAATTTIPIVFGAGNDPVAAGFVASINRPGGNVTGVAVLTNLIEPKRLGLLHELVPRAPLFGVLINQRNQSAPRMLGEIEEAARTLNQPLFIAKAGTDAELDAAFAALTQQPIRAMMMATDPYYDTRRERITDFAARRKVPAIFPLREYAAGGGLLSYGVSLSEAYRYFGTQTARILKGENPAELPVQVVTRFELVLNLKTAKAIGFEFPPTFSARADEVIE